MVATRRSDRREKKRRAPPPPSYSPEDESKILGANGGGGIANHPLPNKATNLTATGLSGKRVTHHVALDRTARTKDQVLQPMMTPTTSATESDASSTTVVVTPPVSERKKKPAAPVTKAKVIKKVTLRKSSRGATKQTNNKVKGTVGSGRATANNEKRRVNTRSAARSAGPDAVELLPGIEDEAQLFKNNKTSSSKKKKSGTNNKPEDPNVTKIQMLTGVLYIYKGSNIPRRVEFVRTR